MASNDVHRMEHEPNHVDFKGNHDVSVALDAGTYRNQHVTMSTAVSAYTMETGMHPDLLILTTDGGVTAAHQYMLANNSLYFFHTLEQDSVISEYNDPKVIMEESITKGGLELLLDLLYLGNSNDFKLDASKMEEVGPEMLVACSRYFFPKYVKEACVVAMKKSITPNNCGEVLKAMKICKNKHYNSFYNAHGLKDACKQFLATTARSTLSMEC